MVSTTEADYLAALDAAKKVVWIRKFASKLGVVPFIDSHIPLFCETVEPFPWQKN